MDLTVIDAMYYQDYVVSYGEPQDRSRILSLVHFLKPSIVKPPSYVKQYFPYGFERPEALTKIPGHSKNPP